MYAIFQIQRASIADPRHLLIEGEVLRGEIEPGERFFLRRKRFIVDNILVGHKTGVLKVGPSSRCVLILRSTVPDSITPELVRFIHGQVIQAV